MQITLASIRVNDQDHALLFYTKIIGFVKKHDIPMGALRWLTVSSPEGAKGIGLVLEPGVSHPRARISKRCSMQATRLRRCCSRKPVAI